MASAESFSKRGEMLSSPLALPAFSLLMILRTVPTIVTAHTFWASRDTRVSYG